MSIVNWPEIDPKYKWAAMDFDGEVYVYQSKPSLDNFGFFSSGYKFIHHDSICTNK